MLTIKTAEGGDSLEFAFQSFQNSILNDPAYCIIDKDFMEISTIKKIFPNCIILLCIFHVLKYQKTLISTARCSSDVTRVDLEKKDSIMESLRSLVYAHTREEAKERSEKFHKEIIGVEVRVGNGDTGYYTNLEDYFMKNWESFVREISVCTSCWSMATVASLVILKYPETTLEVMLTLVLPNSVVLYIMF